MGGYLTHLRHNDFFHRLARAITIPSGLALEWHQFAFLNSNSGNL
jgi:hypothetical protein